MSAHCHLTRKRTLLGRDSLGREQREIPDLVREWSNRNREWSRDEHVVSRESRSQGSPLVFLVSIPVSISRPWSQKSRFQSRYQDSRFNSLNSSLDIKTQISKVSISVSISKLNYQKSQFQSQYPDLTIEFPNFVQTLRLSLQSKNY